MTDSPVATLASTRVLTDRRAQLALDLGPWAGVALAGLLADQVEGGRIGLVAVTADSELCKAEP